MNLAHQISLRSEDFFSAMASQDQLQDHVGETVSEIKHLRYIKGVTGNLNSFVTNVGQGSNLILLRITFCTPVEML